MSSTRSSGIVVAVLAALVLLPNLGGAPLWDDDEPRNAACSLAMLRSGDWVVPTFNGRLRVEKPALVNWLHCAGFVVAGENETGARLGSALLTIGTCLLTWRIGCLLVDPLVGMWAGVVLATCLWTGVTGRASTPDAPLAFFTTLALWAFVRGSRVPGPGDTGWRSGRVTLSRGWACLVGAACGLATLTKGPVGCVLPLFGCGLFAVWQALLDPGRPAGMVGWLASARTGWRGLRPGWIVAALVLVAAPWYLAVSLRTGGEWPARFLLVHNVGRAAAAMEGHSGTPLVYYPIVLLVGTFPWSLIAALVVLHARRVTAAEGPGRVGGRLALCWLAAWVVPFSLAGTKLPGYVWPAYPAVALFVGWFVADWIRRPTAAVDRWMGWAWVLVAAAGVGLVAGFAVAGPTLAPGAERLAVIGLVPLAGAATAWWLHAGRLRPAAAACLAGTACVTIATLVAIGPAAIAGSGGMRQVIARLPDGTGSPTAPVAAFAVPPSTVFYAGRLHPSGTIRELGHPRDVAGLFAAHPDAHLVIDARYAPEVVAVLPPGYGVVQSATTLPESRRLLVYGPLPGIAAGSAADLSALP